MTTRPLSPHLQIYRPQLTSVLSITHRATGVALSLGTVVLLYWLQAAARGEAAYAAAHGVLSLGAVKVLLVAWSWAFFYHLCNGIRHLFWDAGMGFELGRAYASGYAVLASASALTALVWVYVLTQAGGVA
ncbi:MAG: succinate dehydrogenase, cytochrome b556 subunit [Gammaproteobacteria bacterium]|nr:succinate dehydrogenase, cytochrome b556 subunit [Gammaproteobacteria bacterium]